MRIRMAATLLGMVLMTGPALADVTITATQQGKGMVASLMTGEAVTRIKGGKMRGDSSSGDAPTTTLRSLGPVRERLVGLMAKEGLRPAPE